MTAATPRSIETFADAARKFCTFCETRPPLSPDELLELARLLADLNRAALALPDGFDDGVADPGSKVKPLPADSWAAPFDLYWDVFNPLNTDPEEPVANSLEDDVRDIYLDLMTGFVDYDAGFPVAAGWHWRFSFWGHWGAHLVGAQRAIHFCFSAMGDAAG